MLLQFRNSSQEVFVIAAVSSLGKFLSKQSYGLLSLFLNITHKDIKRLQRVQNYYLLHYSRTTFALKHHTRLRSLHCLMVKPKIKFKYNVLTYETILTCHPACIRGYLKLYTRCCFNGEDKRYKSKQSLGEFPFFQ